MRVKNTLPFQTSPNWPAPSLFVSCNDSRGISQASFVSLLRSDITGAALGQGDFKARQRPSALPVYILKNIYVAVDYNHINRKPESLPLQPVQNMKTLNRLHYSVNHEVKVPTILWFLQEE